MYDMKVKDFKVNLVYCTLKKGSFFYQRIDETEQLIKIHELMALVKNPDREDDYLVVTGDDYLKTFGKESFTLVFGE